MFPCRGHVVTARKSLTATILGDPSFERLAVISIELSVANGDGVVNPYRRDTS